MRMQRVAVLILAMVLSLPAVMASPATARQDAGAAEVTIHVNLCVAAGCNEVAEAIEPAEGVTVTLSSMDQGTALGTCTTDDAGTCAIALDAVPEAVTVSVDPATVPLGYVADAGTAPYFLQPETPDVWLLLYPEDGVLEPPPGQDAPAPPVVPATEPADDAMPLPEPLALSLPVWLYGGTCADLEAMAESTFSEQLSDVTIVDGEHRGSPNALVAASGYSELGVPLAAFLEGGYAIFVTDEEQELILCGEIGGPVDQASTMSIGLAPVNDSGAAGVAYIAAQGEAQVGISVFLVPEGLAAPEATPIP